MGRDKAGVIGVGDYGEPIPGGQALDDLRGPKKSSSR
jgi:hypothetical protein